jgi:hypothetical protein
MNYTAIRPSLLMMLILATTGCSLAFVKGPPDGHQGMTGFTCTESRAIPIFETIWAALFIGVGIGSMNEPESEAGYDESKHAGTWIGVGMPIGASALVGFHRTSRCRAALEELEVRVPDRVSLPSARYSHRHPLSP